MIALTIQRTLRPRWDASAGGHQLMPHIISYPSINVSHYSTTPHQCLTFLILIIFHQCIFWIFFVRAVTARLHIPHAEELLNSDSKKKKFLVECESLEPTIEKPWPRFRDFQVVPILNIFDVDMFNQTSCSTIAKRTTGSPWLPTLLPKWATSKNKKAWKARWVDFGYNHVD